MQNTVITKALSITLLLSCATQISAMNNSKVLSRAEQRRAKNQQTINNSSNTCTGSVNLSPALQAQLAEPVKETIAENAFVKGTHAVEEIEMKAEAKNAVEQLVNEAFASEASLLQDSHSSTSGQAEQAMAQSTEAAPASEGNNNNIPAPVPAKPFSFLDHYVVAETKNEKPASLQTSSWRYPIASREADVIAALQDMNAASIDKNLNNGDLVKVINQHMANFIQTLQNTGTQSIMSLEQVLAIGLVEMRAAHRILSLCDEYPKKRAEKIASLKALLACPDNAKPAEAKKATEQLNALEKCTTSRPQDATLILALKTLSTARLLQLEKLHLRMKEGFEQLREIQDGIDLAFRMMPEEVQAELPADLLEKQAHTNDFIYNLTMKQ